MNMGNAGFNLTTGTGKSRVVGVPGSKSVKLSKAKGPKRPAAVVAR
jgi:hypothetical protein